MTTYGVGGNFGRTAALYVTTDEGTTVLQPGDPRVPDAIRATHTGTADIPDDVLSTMYRTTFSG